LDGDYTITADDERRIRLRHNLLCAERWREVLFGRDALFCLQEIFLSWSKVGRDTLTDTRVVGKKYTVEVQDGLIIQIGFCDGCCGLIPTKCIILIISHKYLAIIGPPLADGFLGVFLAPQILIPFMVHLFNLLPAVLIPVSLLVVLKALVILFSIVKESSKDVISLLILLVPEHRELDRVFIKGFLGIITERYLASTRQDA
jgi:hypothetical protein